MIQDAERLQTVLASKFPYEEVGWVDEVIGLVIESRGPQAKIGDVCYIMPNSDESPPLPAEVVGFKAGKLQLMPLGNMTALASGSRVINTHREFKIPVGEALLGRVLDGLGRPMDNRGAIQCPEESAVMQDAPPPLDRRKIDEKLALGVRALDGFTTVGKGQRLGIFSGSGVGKSTLMGMIARNTEADMNVIALIGERGREVKEFIEHALGPEGLQRSVVVVATSEQPALMKIKAALVATTIAEYFRDKGKDVLLMMDSSTRIAMALREVGLSIGEPPTSRGYTPSVFAFLPKLMERSGTSDVGSITGLYTVLVEGDDFNEPISDAVRGILDGHIILSRELAYQNHFPAVDVLGSISRLMINIVDKEHREGAGKIRDLMATYKRFEDIVSIGAYVRGTNAKLDQALILKDPIDSFLKQSITDKFSYDEMLKNLLDIARRIQ
jgi:flagellum-specific ATP synthase